MIIIFLLVKFSFYIILQTNNIENIDKVSDTKIVKVSFRFGIAQVFVEKSVQLILFASDSNTDTTNELHSEKKIETLMLEKICFHLHACLNLFYGFPS